MIFNSYKVRLFDNNSTFEQSNTNQNIHLKPN